MSPGKLPLRTKLGYGVYDLGGNLFFTVTAFVLLNFLTDVVGLAAGLAGTVLMIGRIWDACYDPVIGYLSDRTRTRMGRRRPYILAGAVPLFLAMAAMFTNPSVFAGEGFRPSDHQTALFVWGLVVYIILCTAYSTTNIPYSSLTPELTPDFHERTSLNGFRFAFAILGTLLGAGAALPLVGLFATPDAGFTGLGIIYGVVMLVTSLLTVVAVREQPPEDAPQAGFFDTYLHVFKNRPYMVLLLVYVLHIVAVTVVSGIAIYYFKYVHRDEKLTTPGMLALLVTAMVFVPASVVLSRRVGKKLVYAAGMLLVAVAVMLLFFLGHRVGLAFTYGMLVVTGVGFGFIYVMPYAMVPDAIDHDYAETGLRREGAFYGIWTWALKIGQALAVFCMGWILEAGGYQASATSQPEGALFAIRLCLGPITAVVFVAGALVLRFYPIDEKSHQAIQARIQAVRREPVDGRATAA